MRTEFQPLPGSGAQANLEVGVLHWFRRRRDPQKLYAPGQDGRNGGEVCRKGEGGGGQADVDGDIGDHLVDP